MHVAFENSYTFCCIYGSHTPAGPAIPMRFLDHNIYCYLNEYMPMRSMRHNNIITMAYNGTSLQGESHNLLVTKDH